MWRGSAGLLAAVLALAGCKSTDTKSADKDTAGMAASRTKGSDNTGPNWWETPGDSQAAAETGPTGPAGPAGPRDFAAQDCVAGRVLDPMNRPVQGVFIQIELVNPPAGSPAPVGVYTDQTGTFYTRGLKPGKSYNLTADTSIEGKRFSASVQTVIPSPKISIALRDDLQLPPSPVLKGPSGVFPPPSPFDQPGDRIPASQGFVPPTPKPSDGAWSPGADATRSVPSAITPTPSRTASPPADGFPPPADLTAPIRPVSRPENVADGPKSTFQPPPVTIPGPPTLPPTYPNPPVPQPAPPPGSNMGLRDNGTGFILLDTLGRNWEFPANRSGSIVLLEFMTTDTDISRGVIPSLSNLQARYAASGLQVIGIACNDNLNQQQRIDAAARFARDNNLNYSVFVEPGEVSGGLRNRYNVLGYPNAVLLDGSGRLLWQGHPNERDALEAAIKRALGR